MLDSLLHAIGTPYAVAAYLDGLIQLGDRMVRCCGVDKDDVCHEIVVLINYFAELNDYIKHELVRHCSDFDKRNTPYHIGDYTCWLEINTDEGLPFCLMCDDQIGDE